MTIRIFIVLFFLLFMGAQEGYAQCYKKTAQYLNKQAVESLNKGDIQRAKEKFELVLQFRPYDQTARCNLQKINNQSTCTY